LPTFNQPAPLPTNSIGADNKWFPSDLESYKFYITFDFRKFTRRDITDRAFYGPGASGTVRLPIPANMVDTSAVNWEGDTSLNPVLGSIIDTGARLKNTNDSSASTKQQLQTTLENLIKKGGLLAESPLALLAKGYALTGAAEAVAGVAINPFMTVLFQSPTFKRHRFQWAFMPQSKDETDTLRNILARFRLNMLPSLNGAAGVATGLLLNYPNMCYVTLLPNNKDLYKFKPCVITNASINYAPSGPSFFGSTQAPTMVILTVDLLEMEYWIQEDVLATWDTNLSAGGSIGVDTNVTATNAQDQIAGSNITSGAPGL
jgi:hypothetical protein